VTFAEAQLAFLDPKRVIARDVAHSGDELRFYCFGEVTGVIPTVRFTYRSDVIRIIGAGYWRRGRRVYEKEIHCWVAAQMHSTSAIYYVSRRLVEREGHEGDPERVVVSVSDGCGPATSRPAVGTVWGRFGMLAPTSGDRRSAL
jgi:uncharacterized DUF497 family protein